MGIVVAGLQVLSLVLQVVLIALLLRRPLRRYLFFLFYSVVYLVATIVQVLVYRLRGQDSLYRNVYWTGEVFLDLLLFLMVILLTYQALESSAARASAGRFLTVVAVMALVLPFIVFPGPLFKPRWFNSTSQMLNFGGAILNLGLWGALIARKNRDPQLLTVSVGLGIAVTAAAIEFGLRAFITGEARALVNLFSPVMHVASLVLWCWAFRPPARNKAPGAALPQHS